MSDLHDQLARLLEDFTGKVAALAQRSIVETARAALGARAEPVRGDAAPPRRGGAATEAAAVGARIVSHLLAAPGQRMDELVARFQLPAPALRPVIRHLVADGMLRFEGNTRGRRYYAANGATSAGTAGAPPRRGRRRTKPGVARR